MYPRLSSKKKKNKINILNINTEKEVNYYKCVSMVVCFHYQRLIYCGVYL